MKSLKTNRSFTMRAAAVACVLCLLMTCAIAGSVAKYTSSVNGTDTISVAKWEWTYTINDIESGESTSATQDLKLFEDTELMDLDDDENVGDTADVGIHEGLIAPGVGGSFDIKVLNASQVDAVYTITLAEEASETLPIEYSLDNQTWYDDFTEINDDATLKAVEVDKDQTTSRDITVYWRWAFEPTVSNDTADTGFGVAAQTTPDTATITVTIECTQVD